MGGTLQQELYVNLQLYIFVIAQVSFLCIEDMIWLKKLKS